jgi:hypothetical protein
MVFRALWYIVAIANFAGGLLDSFTREEGADNTLWFRYMVIGCLAMLIAGQEKK